MLARTRYFARKVKYRLIRLLRYAPSYHSLDPQDYSLARFKAEASMAKKVHQDMLHCINTEGSERSEADHIHPTWQTYLRQFRQVMMSGLPEYFFDEPVIRSTMVRRGWTQTQQYEQDYIQRCSPTVQNYLAAFRESRVGGPFLESTVYHCSANSLGHLYYLVRILENHLTIVEREHTVVEFGGVWEFCSHLCQSCARYDVCNCGLA